jgi:hypothetical protein
MVTPMQQQEPHVATAVGAQGVPNDEEPFSKKRCPTGTNMTHHHTAICYSAGRIFVFFLSRRYPFRFRRWSRLFSFAWPGSSSMTVVIIPMHRREPRDIIC